LAYTEYDDEMKNKKSITDEEEADLNPRRALLGKFLSFSTMILQFDLPNVIITKLNNLIYLLRSLM
jgi:hypothetical protein